MKSMCKDEGMVYMWAFQMKAVALFRESGLVQYLSPEGKAGLDEGLLTIENLLSDPGIQKMVSESLEFYNSHYDKVSGD